MSHYTTWTNKELVDYLVGLLVRIPTGYNSLAVKSLCKEILLRMSGQENERQRLILAERECAIAKGLQEDDEWYP